VRGADYDTTTALLRCCKRKGDSAKKKLKGNMARKKSRSVKKGKAVNAYRES